MRREFAEANGKHAQSFNEPQINNIPADRPTIPEVIDILEGGIDWLYAPIAYEVGNKAILNQLCRHAATEQEITFTGNKRVDWLYHITAYHQRAVENNDEIVTLHTQSQHTLK